MNLVIWGHEHESLIYPRPNAETGFDVIQPGSTVATSLVQGESEAKHVCILSITGRDYQSEAIRLKSIRPFKTKDISLAEDKVTKKLAKKDNNRGEITRRLTEIVEELIVEATTEWQELQEDNDAEEDIEIPKPLIRLRVEYTAPEGGSFDCENPQRFSNRFADKVANTSDVVHFWRKKTTTTRKGKTTVDQPEESAHEPLSLDSIKVDKLVREYLTAQSLTILPQNSFGDAVNLFVDKDDKHAMENFVFDSLKSQVDHLLSLDGGQEDNLGEEMESEKSRLEQLFAQGDWKNRREGKLKHKPGDWDSDDQGHWEDQLGAWEQSDSDLENSDDDASVAATSAPTTRGRGGRGRGRGTGTTRTTAAKKTTAAAKKAPMKSTSTRGRKKQIVEEDSEEDEDIVMDDAGDQDDSQLFPLFVKQRGGSKAATKSTAAPTKRQPARKAAAASSSRGTGVSKNMDVEEISDDIEDDDDDDDAFEEASVPSKSRGRR